MKRWVVAGIVLALGVLVVGLVLTYVPRVQQAGTVAGCKNNLREAGLFAGYHAEQVGAIGKGAEGGETFTLPAGVAVDKLAPVIPAGTVVLPGVPPEDRLSWYPAALPGFDQKRQDMAPILAALDRTAPWPAARNQEAGRAKLVALLCPGNPPPVSPDGPGPTSYVGVGGLGADAPTLTLPPPPAVPPPRAGCFRYDQPTPFLWNVNSRQSETVRDGLSQTLMLGERSGDVGPWLRGGPATVRPLDDAPGAPPLLGVGKQFGGCHPNGALWAFADGSARFVTDQVDPRVLYSQATIAGGEKDPVPGGE